MFFRRILALLSAAVFLFSSASVFAASGGGIAGTVADPSSAVIAGAKLRLVNTAQLTVWQAATDKQGLYSFPNLPVGRYELTVTADGFSPQKRTGISVDTDAAIRLDVVLTVGGVVSGTGPVVKFQV